MSKRKAATVAVMAGILTYVAVLLIAEAAGAATYHKHHGCKHGSKHGRCHRHKKAKQGGKKVHLVPPPVKTGPFCDPQQVFASPDPAECEPDKPSMVCTRDPCGPVDTGSPCSYVQCEETAVPLEAKNMEVFRSDFKGPPATYGCAYIYGATEYGMHSDAFTIEFRARYGSFESQISGGFKNKYELAQHYCGKYVTPCPANMPADGYDMAWVVVYDRTKHTYVESEQVVFDVEEPDIVHHPVG